MPLEFGSHEDVVFDRAPLRTVLCQVMFSPILSLLTKAGAAGFQEALRGDYPIFEMERSLNLSVSDDSSTIREAASIWKLKNETGTWVVSLSANFVALETSAYLDIEDFITRLDRVLSVTARVLQPSSSSRIGLRKVNAFEVKGTKIDAFDAVVTPELLGPLKLHGTDLKVSTFFSQIDYDDDGAKMVVRHGLGAHNDDSIEFVLDLDYYTEIPREVNGGESMSGLIRHFSQGITSFFHASIKPEFKESLLPRPKKGN